MSEAHDEDLRALLATADPAAALPPADPAGVARLMEDLMPEMPEHTDVHEGVTTENRADHLRQRSRLTWIVAAAAAAVIVGGVAFVLIGGSGEDGPGSAGSEVVDSRVTGDADGAIDPGEAASVTELTLSGDASAARCLTPESAPQVVAAQTLVVDAVVESISGGVVTLAPTTFYAGEATDLVTVSEPEGDLTRLLAGVEFTEGGRYLVSATDGRVTLCGFSGPYSASLAGIYKRAFTG
ncbi:hypothetical protein [Nocardioides sp.]|uniref:hypothetical protein n=1 Tax=Nocardioides sp. TaxID=35761 RepID=UPI002B2706B7|nr:hypothetical protein [Nocardioides sp.]